MMATACLPTDLQRILLRERDMPSVTINITNDSGPPDPTTTVAVICGAVDASGNADEALSPYIAILRPPICPAISWLEHGPHG
jgi:hypothetical protein